MKVLISGGSGFLGRNLSRSLIQDNHQIFILTRGSRVIPGATALPWDARSVTEWAGLVNEMDVVVHLAGKSLATWPWTSSTKRAFHDSRILPGLALVAAIEKANHRPRLFIQQSGINHYGLRGEAADESTPPADDFLAKLTSQWEDATKPVEDMGLRRIILRTAVVLGKGEGLMPLMVLPVQLFLGGPLGSGHQAVPWIHLVDWVNAVKYLINLENAHGAYNLIAPQQTSNAEFTKQLAKVLHKLYWFPTPAILLRILLGEMSVLILEGRFARPKRLIESGYQFQFPTAHEAFIDLYRNSSKEISK